MRETGLNGTGKRRYCPDLTELAAFLDGAGLPWKRLRTMEHLNACSLCYTVFVETVRCQETLMEVEVN